MAGGGVKGGIRYGATNEHGYQAVENKTHIHDLHATMLHLMGHDHKKFTYNHASRDFRLTDVHMEVLKGLSLDPSQQLSIGPIQFLLLKRRN